MNPNLQFCPGRRFERFGLALALAIFAVVLLHGNWLWRWDRLFYDWQLAQTAEESWRECHLHARNLLGEVGYAKLLADIEAERNGEPTADPLPIAAEPVAAPRTRPQTRLFD